MTTPFEARVHAPTAPLWQRVLAYGLGWLLILAGLVALNSFPVADTLLGIGAWIVVMSPFLMRHRNAKSSQIHVSPGKIEIRAARSFPRTILTRSLRGAAIEHAKDKNILWLAESSSPNTPITIEADERGLKDIRKALGIRRGGFGEIRKWPDNDKLQQAEGVARAAIGVLLTFSAIEAMAFPKVDIVGPVAFMFVCSLVVSTLATMKRAPRVKLAEETANDTNNDETLDINRLKRGNASALDWIARIDALASMQSDVGYRVAQIPIDELWSALENHETAHDVRAAAARVLLRVSPEKSADRIAAALASIHDDTERAHLRAALDSDPEAAAREIESLDDEMIDRR
jgi:hypothetical protein